METQKKTVLENQEKTYTKTELFTYSGIAALLTGVIGYFIGENRGEKKAKEKFEYAVNKWKEKAEKRKKEDQEEEFVM
ncbi:MAG TPA: hypothetical protein PK637_14215 [Flavobacteriales bacterium]|nr:hypothetical protein [Flavobacteriales bacterium]HRE97920.1 hypothetical protein [Flavobacteriales bacterium]